MPLYFAYGSNLSPAQMVARCGRVEHVGPAQLFEHRLVFAGASKNWGGAGVATIVPAPGHTVYGCLYELDLEAFERLDRHEGSYERTVVEVDERQASTYVRRAASPRRSPSPAYVAIIAHAYGVHGHPLAALITALAAVE